MNQNIIILILLIINSKIFINGFEFDDENPKEIKHGILFNDNWINYKSYEYYINITDYELNEENIFELYTKQDWNIIFKMNIYTLLTNASLEEILNNTIRPTDSDLYNKENSIKFDFYTFLNYFFMPFKKTYINQTFFIILIIPDKSLSNDQEVYYSISNRIPIIHLNPKENNKIIFSESLEARNDIRLYYKFELDKNINLIDNNIFFFINDKSIQSFSTNLTSLITYDNNMFMIQKKKNQITNIYLGLKSIEKSIYISINLDKNNVYILNGKQREKQKIYIEHINCKNTFYIIENYDDYFDDEMKMFLFIDKLYGNYLLKYYDSFKYENFEFILEEKGTEIIDKITNIKGKIKIYSLTCITPTAFTFELFSNEEAKKTLEEGKQIKSFLLSDITSKITMNINDEMKKYKFFISLLDKDYRNETQNITCDFNYRNNKKQFILENQDNKHYEIMYYGDKDNIDLPTISLDSDKGTFINYYLTSNRLFYKIEEGETIIDSLEMKNLIFRINKDLLFDYITFEVESKLKNININYEIKQLNKEYIDNYYKIMAPLPEINIHSFNSVILNFSNPYNKYDSIFENDKDSTDNFNAFFLLISFIELNINNPIYINIKYNYNENIIPLLQTKTEILIPENEYEIYGDKNYLYNSKILFNINKCDFSKNYLFINYYENNNIIINENNITNNREIILSNNIFYNSKLKILNLNSDNNNNENKDDNYYPADYYNKGDIILNYFLTNEDLYNQIIITKNFTINYEDKMRSNIILYWNQYIFNNNKNILYSTNYSIYILPKESIVNTMCQLLLIPSNYSIINANELEIDIEEGDYKVAIIASVIDKDFPITSMYDILFLNVGKRLNIALIIVLILSGIIIIFIIFFLIFRKKRKFLCIKRDDRAFSSKIEEKNNEDKVNDSKKSNSKKSLNLSENLLKNIIKMNDKKVEDNDSDKNNIDEND